MKLKFLILSILFFAGLSLQAQVRFEAKVSKDKLGVNERLRVDFEMNQDGDNFRPPSFDGFTVVGGPNQAVSNRWINGDRTYSKTYSYYLQPNSRGRKTIAQAEITVDDKIYKTTPVDVEVTAAVEKPTDGDDSELIASDNLHLVAEVSDATPYLNEGITVVYKLYVSPRISVSNFREVDSPKFSDFWSQNIEIRELRPENGEYRGEPYRYVVLKKAVLYPQKTGELELEPLTLSVSVDVPSDRRDIFGSRIYKTINKTVAAGTRTIDVKPLPDGKPAGFTGAVGKFSMDVSTTKEKLKASESLEAKVEIRGNGNLNLFELPALEVPSSLEMYSPERKENVTTTLNGKQGSIIDSYTIVPTRKGQYPIKPLNFSYFDPQSETYKTLSSQEIVIDVEEGPATGGNAVAGNTRQSVNLPSEQFRFIKTNTNLKPLDQQAFFRSWTFWGSLFLPFAAIPLFILFGKRREAKAADVTGNRRKKADKLARKYLSEAKKNLGDQQSFYESLERAMHNYLKAKLHIQTAEMSKERISEILKEKNVADETSTEFIEVLKSCEFARYTPASNTAQHDDYDKAVKVISKLDKDL
ncbi:BatD family protein [Salegentibacter salarius]|uniref:BatD protein n=1 Tax=Salegentibacter salarius TaxID=435906 RepID=A0A2N0TUR3_9FLAO|nr:BatD family protein [Salegentibacter salarius]OEY72159.1 BatD protein [Salegentibacter salarius]PKD18480.1 BatD protein [Salegentibacter salarius]SLJ87904.1 Oxygen tolerance [Salegentibacter salarius]